VLVVGSPGRVVRPLTDEQKAYLLKVADGYVERGRYYRQNLRPQ
jgi:carbonic anhydrase/acetyltransferase-like protein (isoleucine patch superfamily)